MWGREIWKEIDGPDIKIWISHVDAHTGKTSTHEKHNTTVDKLSKLKLESMTITPIKIKKEGNKWEIAKEKHTLNNIAPMILKKEKDNWKVIKKDNETPVKVLPINLKKHHGEWSINREWTSQPHKENNPSKAEVTAQEILQVH